MRRFTLTGLGVTVVVSCALNVACLSFGPTKAQIQEADRKTSQLMASWMGHTEHELLLSWGPPESRVSDGDGGSILTYRFHRNQGSTNGYVQHYGFYNSQGQWVSFGDSYVPPQDLSYDAIRVFYVDQGGRVYSWRWKGL